MRLQKHSLGLSIYPCWQRGFDVCKMGCRSHAAVRRHSRTADEESAKFWRRQFEECQERLHKSSQVGATASLTSSFKSSKQNCCEVLHNHTAPALHAEATPDPSLLLKPRERESLVSFPYDQAHRIRIPLNILLGTAELFLTRIVFYRKRRT